MLSGLIKGAWDSRVARMKHMRANPINPKPYLFKRAESRLLDDPWGESFQKITLPEALLPALSPFNEH